MDSQLLPPWACTHCSEYGHYGCKLRLAWKPCKLEPFPDSRVAQLEGQRALNPHGEGSNPSTAASSCEIIDERAATTPEPPPQPGKQDVTKFVIQDLRARSVLGEQKYGTILMTHNGRDALVDAYQEALDLCCYLKQALLERSGQ